MSRRALLLVNPHARQGSACSDELMEGLRAGGLELVCDKREGETVGQAITRHREDVDLVIIGGGDGTLNEAIGSLIDTQLPLGILPLGTANDLARTLNLPLDLAQASAAITGGELKSIDVGEANGVYFFNVASLGLSVDITRDLTPEAKKLYGVFAYLFTAFKRTFRVQAFHAEIRTPTETHRVKTVQIAVGNGRFYGGGMAVAEDASIDDGQLDLYSVEVDHWWKMFAVTPAILRGKQQQSMWVRTHRGAEFEVLTRRRRPINTDGEIRTYTPVKFRVLHKAIQVFVPAAPSTAPKGS